MTLKQVSLALLVSSISFCSSQAQYFKRKTGFATTINGLAISSPVNSFTDTIGSFANNQLGASVIAPLFGRMSIKEKGDNPRLFQTFLSLGAVAGKPEINFEYTFRDRTLFSAAAGLNVLYYFGKRNTILGGAYAFMGEDNVTYRDPDVRYAGFLVFNHNVADKGFSYKLGGFYTFLFGKGIFLPIAGITVDLSEKSRINAVFPLTLSFSHTNVAGHRYRLFVKPRGELNNFNNEDADMQFNYGQNPVIQVRRTEIRAGGDVRVQLHRDFFLKMEVGAMVYRNLGFFLEGSNIDNSIYDTDIDPGAYIQLGVSWKIRKKAKEGGSDGGEGKSTPVFVDFSNFNLDDLDLNELNIQNIEFEEIDFDKLDLDDIDLEDVDIEDIIDEPEE